MNDSAFNRSLDALVRGDSVNANEDLAGFATNLYRKEHDVVMPASVKSSIAARLGLEPGVEAAHASPISRRAARARVGEREYARRPWSIAAAIVIAVSLAFTGILQWSLPSGNDGDRDNRFGMLSPAVPTVDATPAARIDPTPENSWFVPVSSDECPVNELIDRGKWIERQQDMADNFEEMQRSDVPYSKPDRADAEAVVIRNRQAVSCQALETNDALPIESSGWAWESQITSEPHRDEVFADRLQRSKEFSDYVENELGLTPADLLHESESETGRVWDPSNAVQMADGRIALVTGWFAPADQELPTASSFANVWIEEDGQWLLDESLFFCIGDCEEYWSEREAATVSDATPFASPVVDETCEIPETFEADYEVVAAGPVILRPGPGIGSGDPLDVLPVGTQVMYLCEMVPTSDPARDELDEGQMWLKLQTEMGTVGWMREINVSLASESSTPIIDHANEQAVPMGGDNRVTPVPTPSD